MSSTRRSTFRVDILELHASKAVDAVAITVACAVGPNVVTDRTVNYEEDDHEEHESSPYQVITDATNWRWH